MEPADSIARIGFRRWYERQMIEGHAWLISGLLCVLALVACIEELRFHGLLAQLAFGLAILAAGLIAVYALLRYFVILASTLRLGEHATCRSCGTYGRFEVISGARVRCRECGNEWPLVV